MFIYFCSISSLDHGLMERTDFTDYPLFSEIFQILLSAIILWGDETLGRHALLSRG